MTTLDEIADAHRLDEVRPNITQENRRVTLMTTAGTVTRVERLRIKTRSTTKRGGTVQDIEDQIACINSYLLISALFDVRSARLSARGNPLSRNPYVTKGDVRSAERGREQIRVRQLTLNSPLNMLLEQITAGYPAAVGLGGLGVLTSAYILYNRLLKASDKTLGVADKYIDLKVKRSESKVTMARNRLAEEELKDQLYMQQQSRRARGKLVDITAMRPGERLSEEEQLKLEEDITRAAIAISMIESLEVED